jgi:hypothetical protein
MAEILSKINVEKWHADGTHTPVVPADEYFHSKVVALYFSAQWTNWCEQNNRFTKELKVDGCTVVEFKCNYRNSTRQLPAGQGMRTCGTR